MKPFFVAVVFVAMFAGCLEEKPVVEKGTGDSKGLPTAPPIAFPATATWREGAQAQIPRAEHCAANVGSKFYVIGGYLIANPISLPGAAGGVPTGPPLNLVEIYDAQANTWTQGPAYPINTDHCLAVAVNDTIYVVYSATGGGSYKIKAGQTTWTKIASPSNGHNAGVAEAIDGKIYATGGGSTAVDVYDPAADRWETAGAPMPTRRGHTSGSAVGRQFFVIGGDTAGHSQNTGANEMFDLDNGTWSNRSALPKVRGSLHAVTWFGRILVMGGQDGRTNVDAYNDVNVYDPVTDQWSELPKLPAGRHGFAAGVWNDKVYVFGGAPQQGVSGFAKLHVLEAAK